MLCNPRRGLADATTGRLAFIWSDSSDLLLATNCRLHVSMMKYSWAGVDRKQAYFKSHRVVLRCRLNKLAYVLPDSCGAPTQGLERPPRRHPVRARPLRCAPPWSEGGDLAFQPDTGLPEFKFKAGWSHPTAHPHAITLTRQPSIP